jgi:hypothetical protein
MSAPRKTWLVDLSRMAEDDPEMKTSFAPCASPSRHSIAWIRSPRVSPRRKTLALSANKPVALLLCRDLMWEEV